MLENRQELRRNSVPADAVITLGAMWCPLELGVEGKWVVSIRLNF